MPIHSLNAIPPFVHVGLSVGITLLYRKLGPPPIDKNALIDTGASLTAISHSIVQALHPQQVGLAEYLRPDALPIWQPVYSIRLCFEPDLADPDWPRSAHWFDVRAVVATIATPGVEVLIGQNLLDQLALSWDGPRSRLLLMY